MIDDTIKIIDVEEAHATSVCTIILIYIISMDTLLYKISEISIHKSQWWSRHSQHSYNGQWIKVSPSLSTNRTPSLILQVTIIMATLKEITQVKRCICASSIYMSTGRNMWQEKGTSSQTVGNKTQHAARYKPTPPKFTNDFDTTMYYV